MDRQTHNSEKTMTITMKARKTTKEILKLKGKARDEVYSLLGKPDYLEIGGTQLVYIKRSWFRRKAFVIDLDPDDIVESVDKLHWC